MMLNFLDIRIEFREDFFSAFNLIAQNVIEVIAINRTNMCGLFVQSNRMQSIYAEIYWFCSVDAITIRLIYEHG